MKTEEIKKIVKEISKELGISIPTEVEEEVGEEIFATFFKLHKSNYFDFDNLFDTLMAMDNFTKGYLACLILRQRNDKLLIETAKGQTLKKILLFIGGFFSFDVYFKELCYLDSPHSPNHSNFTFSIISDHHCCTILPFSNKYTTSIGT